MQTIKIGGKELPVPVGCSDFRMGEGRFAGEIVFRLGDTEDSWLRFSLLDAVQRSHAASRAHAHFTKLADALVAEREGQSVLFYDPDDGEVYYDNMKAATAWLELVED